MNEEDVFLFYKETFQVIYADLVAITQTKPLQILIEIENAFTHISSAKVHSTTSEENYKKAKGHLIRASLDCAKMLWIEQSRLVKSFSHDDDLKQYCVNCSEAVFVKMIIKANDLAIDARRHEIKNVGVAPTVSIEKYYEAALLMGEALSVCDFEKLASFKRFRFAHWMKQHAISLLIGLLSGIIVSWMFS